MRAGQKQTPALAALLAVACLALLAPPAASAASPWWQVLPGSRPTNLQPAPDQTERQELTTSPFEGKLTVTVEVAGEPIGCLGAGGGAAFCKSLTGFEPTQTAPELQELLEGPYGEDVKVTGGPAGGEPFLITTPGRWVSPVTIAPTPLVTLGSASARAISEGSGRLVVIASNLGDAPLDATETPSSISLEELPEGIVPYGVEAFAGASGSAGPVQCAIALGGEVSCSFEGELPPYSAIEVEVLVAVKTGAGSGEGEIALSGADAAPASAAQPVTVSSDPVPFGFERFFTQAEEEGGSPAEAAAGYPFQWTNTVQFDSGRVIPGINREDTVVEQPGVPRNVGVKLPAGLVGSATAVEPCTMARFFSQSPDFTNGCPASSAVGVASVTVLELASLGLVRVGVPIFSLTPAHGEPARFGFQPVGVPVTIDTSVDPDDHYRITGEVRNASQTARVLSATLSLWGVPGDPRHDSNRGWDCVAFNAETTITPRECNPPRQEERPLLRLPVSCASPLEYLAFAEPWNAAPGSEATQPASAPAPRGCSGVPFDPQISDSLTSRLAANPSGLDFELDLPGQWPDPPATPEAQPKRVEVTLPTGVTINPSQAEGLATCSEADYGRERYDSQPGEGCPEASKIGSVRVSTPLLEEEATGALYVATPYENPTHSLIGLYLVAKIPERGVLVKQAGKVEPDPSTGQLVSTFDEIPQLPFSSFKLHFREGGRSPLVTPPGCGAFTTTARFTPWSAHDPEDPSPGEIVTKTATFTIERGVDGGACPSGPAPFAPGFEAGTENNQAGSYSPFLMRLTRKDGEQDMGKFSFVLPPGVVPKLAGIPYCPEEAGIARAQSRQGPHGGQEEIDDPSCPAASQIGRTVAGAGVGNQLTYVGGKLYLAGPYHGDPISAVAITPAVAGPFDAGTVVVREALRLNPVTHVGEVDGQASDPIPHILKGIPLNLRDLRVYADKPEFTLNATSCDPFEASATIWGDGTALEPRGETPVGLASRYQAAGCASLGFAPKLAIKLKGGTKRGKFPALKAVVTPRPGDANFARAVVTLPHSAFLEQGHFGTICTRVQFASGGGNGEACPAASRYGWARAFTPLLAEPLEGPVFLRSSSHNLPDLVLALHGLVDIDLASRIDSRHGGIRSTFEDVPDAPVSRFILDMQGGRKGLIVNSTDLCTGKHRATANLTGQNGRADRARPLVRAEGCPKAKRHKRHHKRGGRR